MNHVDDRGRVPLHYAFVKIGDHNNRSAIDPIETVSSLCAIKDLQIEVADRWKKTPLHYAAKRSATICSLYIIQRGAQLESKDIYGNTPLVVALQNNHFNFGIILIQKSADVTALAHKEYPNRLKKMWKDLEAASEKGDEEMSNENDGEYEEQR